MSKSKKTAFEMAVVDKVATIRREKGISQDGIATILGLTRGFIGQVESPSNASTYSLNHLNRLAFEFGCSVHDLVPESPIEEIGWD